jgi:hypothetical protein
VPSFPAFEAVGLQSTGKVRRHPLHAHPQLLGIALDERDGDEAATQSGNGQRSAPTLTIAFAGSETLASATDAAVSRSSADSLRTLPAGEQSEI